MTDEEKKDMQAHEIAADALRIAADALRVAPHINFVQQTLLEIYKTHHSLPQAVEAFTAMQDAANAVEYHPHTDDLVTVLEDMFEELTTTLFGDYEE